MTDATGDGISGLHLATRNSYDVIIIGCGSQQEIVSELTCSWRPDLVLVGSRARHGMEPNNERMAHDVPTVQYNRPSFPGRLINALAAAL